MWFKVDDGFYTSDKVLAIPRGLRRPAVGLWTLAGTWSAQKLRDGFVPDHVLDEFGGTPEEIEALVVCGLWRRRRGGIVFVNWKQYQPTREEVEKKRASETERKRDYRERMAREARESGARSARVPTGQDGDTAPPDPTRPDPTRIDRLTPPDELISGGQHTREGSSPQGGDESVQFDSIRVAETLIEVAPGFEGTPPDWLEGRAVIAARHILRKSKRRVADPTAYVIRSIRKDPDGWERFAQKGQLP